MLANGEAPEDFYLFQICNMIKAVRFLHKIQFTVVTFILSNNFLSYTVRSKNLISIYQEFGINRVLLIKCRA